MRKFRDDQDAALALSQREGREFARQVIYELWNAGRGEEPETVIERLMDIADEAGLEDKENEDNG